MQETDASCPHRDHGEICEACAYEHIRQALIADPNRLDRAADIVRRAARALVGADGITLVVREGDHVAYVEEDAISPLWKGRRFPIAQCVSGWVISHGETATIPDVYADPRVPQDAYRPTFVKSMAMVPVGAAPAIGAVGAYWATAHHATESELETLKALADSAFLAIGAA